MYNTLDDALKFAESESKFTGEYVYVSYNRSGDWFFVSEGYYPDEETGGWDLNPVAIFNSGKEV